MGLGICLQYGGERGREGGGFSQVAQTADAAQGGGLKLLQAQIQRFAVAAVQMVGIQQQIAHTALAAVGSGVAAALCQRIAVAEVSVGVLMGEVEGGDIKLRQGKQFAFLADAVLVQIAPHAQALENGILRINDAVLVGIVLRQRGIAVFGRAAVGEQGVVAEQLATVVDAAVAVQIQGQQPVVGRHPAAGGADAVAVVVEQAAGKTGGGGGFDAVAVQVEGDGVVDVKFLAAALVFAPFV